MPWNENHVVAQGPELLTNGIQQCGMVTTGKVGATDGTLEQHVSHQRQPAFGVEEDQVPGRVARAVQYLELERAEPYPVALLQPAVGLLDLPAVALATDLKVEGGEAIGFANDNVGVLMQ